MGCACVGWGLAITHKTWLDFSNSSVMVTSAEILFCNFKTNKKCTSSPCSGDREESEEKN